MMGFYDMQELRCSFTDELVTESCKTWLAWLPTSPSLTWDLYDFSPKLRMPGHAKETANGDRGWAILVQWAKRGFSHSCRSQNPSIAKDLTRGVEGRGAGENRGFLLEARAPVLSRP